MEQPVMEEFRRLIVNTGRLNAIALVYNQFVEFVCLKNRLFTLNAKGSYVMYNNPDTTEGDTEMAMDGIAGRLLSVVAMLGSRPRYFSVRG